MSTLMPAEVFPPGEYLRDELDERGWSVTEFAEILGRPVQAISEILNGKKEITAETALDIASALGTSAELWLNLENAYKLHKVRDSGRDQSDVARRGRLRSLAPIREMQQRGWISDSADTSVLERDVLDLFGLTSLDAAPDLAFAAKRANADEPPTSTQVAWLAFVRHAAKSRTVGVLDSARLKDFASGLPRRLRDVPLGLRNLEADLADLGVALVVEPGLKGSKLDGAAMLGDGGGAVVGLTARYDRLDMFVFALLHELAHLVLGHVNADSRALVDEGLESSENASDVEGAANDQASEWIFPGGFTAPQRLSVPAIALLASDFGVHPCLVIGRLQRDGALDWSKLRNHIPKVRPFLAEIGS